MNTDIEKYKEIAKVYNLEFDEKTLAFGRVYSISAHVIISRTYSNIHCVSHIYGTHGIGIKGIQELKKNLKKADSVLTMLKLHGFEVMA